MFYSESISFLFKLSHNCCNLQLCYFNAALRRPVLNGSCTLLHELLVNVPLLSSPKDPPGYSDMSLSRARAAIIITRRPETIDTIAFILIAITHSRSAQTDKTATIITPGNTLAISAIGIVFSQHIH